MEFIQALVASALFYGWLFWLWVVADSPESTTREKSIKTTSPEIKPFLFNPFLDTYTERKNLDYYQEEQSLELYQSLDLNLNFLSVKKDNLQMVSFNKVNTNLDKTVESSLVDTKIFVDLYTLSNSIRWVILNQKSNTKEVFDELKNTFNKCFSATTIQNVETFFNIPLNDLTSLTLGFLGQKVYQVAFFIYGVHYFSKWQALGLTKYGKTNILFNYIFVPEISCFVLNFLKFVINDTAMFPGFTKNELKKAITLYMNHHQSVFEIGYPVKNNFNPVTQFVYKPTNLLGLSNFCMSTFNPEIWAKLKKKEKYAFLKSTLVMTSQLGSFSFIKAFMESVTLINNKEGLIVGFNFTPSSGISLKDKSFFNTTFASFSNSINNPSGKSTELNGDNTAIKLRSKAGSSKRNSIISNAMGVGVLVNPTDPDSNGDWDLTSKKIVENSTIIITDLSSLTIDELNSNKEVNALIFNANGSDDFSEFQEVQLVPELEPDQPVTLLNCNLKIKFTNKEGVSLIPIEDWFQTRAYLGKNVELTVDVLNKFFAVQEINLDTGTDFKSCQRGILLIDIGEKNSLYKAKKTNNVKQKEVITENPLGLIIPFFPVTYSNKIKVTETNAVLVTFIKDYIKDSLEANTSALSKLRLFNIFNARLGALINKAPNSNKLKQELDLYIKSGTIPNSVLKLVVDQFAVLEFERLHSVLKAASNNSMLLAPHARSVAFVGPQELNGGEVLDRQSIWGDFKFSADSSELENIFAWNLTQILKNVKQELLAEQLKIVTIPEVWQVTVLIHLTTNFIGDMPRILKPYYLLMEDKFLMASPSEAFLAQSQYSILATFAYIKGACITAIQDACPVIRDIYTHTAITLYGVTDAVNYPVYLSRARSANIEAFDLVYKELTQRPQTEAKKAISKTLFKADPNILSLKNVIFKVGGILDCLYITSAAEANIYLLFNFPLKQPLGFGTPSSARQPTKSPYREVDTSVIAGAYKFLTGQSLPLRSIRGEYIEFSELSTYTKVVTGWRELKKDYTVIGKFLKSALAELQANLTYLQMVLESYLLFLVSKLEKEKAALELETQAIDAASEESIKLRQEAFIEKSTKILQFEQLYLDILVCQKVLYLYRTRGSKKAEIISKTYGFTMEALYGSEPGSIKLDDVARLYQDSANQSIDFDKSHFSSYCLMIDKIIQTSPLVQKSLTLATLVLGDRYSSEAVGTQAQLDYVNQTNTSDDLFNLGKISQHEQKIKNHIIFDLLNAREDTIYKRMRCLNADLDKVKKDLNVEFNPENNFPGIVSAEMVSFADPRILKAEMKTYKRKNPNSFKKT